MENKDSSLGLESVPVNLGPCPANSPNRTSYSFQTWCLQVVCAADTWEHMRVNYSSVEEVLCHPDSPEHPSSQWKQVSCHHCQLRIPVVCSFFYKFLFLCVCMCDQSCPTLWDSTGYSPPGSSVCGILQVRILEGVVISHSRGPSQARDWTHISCISCIGRRILYHSTTWEAKIFIYYFTIIRIHWQFSLCYKKIEF